VRPQIRVTDIIANTYYARIHLGRPAPPASSSSPPPGAASPPPPEDVDVDARPSDAINLAVRFGAPMYVARRIVETAATPPLEPFGLAAAAGSGSSAAAAAAAAEAAGGGYGAPAESNAEIVRSVRETLSSYDDPTGAPPAPGPRPPAPGPLPPAPEGPARRPGGSAPCRASRTRALATLACRIPPLPRAPQFPTQPACPLAPLTPPPPRSDVPAAEGAGHQGGAL
jgi:hypothetical protein